jgi:hypothetical protein
MRDSVTVSEEHKLVTGRGGGQQEHGEIGRGIQHQGICAKNRGDGVRGSEGIGREREDKKEQGIGGCQRDLCGMLQMKNPSPSWHRSRDHTHTHTHTHTLPTVPR